MPNYQKLYTTLFNYITDALGMLEEQNYGAAKKILRTAQETTEELFMSEGESDEGISGDNDRGEDLTAF